MNHKRPMMATLILPKARSTSPLRCSSRHDAVVDATRNTDTTRESATRRVTAKRSCFACAIGWWVGFRVTPARRRRERETRFFCEWVVHVARDLPQNRPNVLWVLRSGFLRTRGLMQEKETNYVVDAAAPSFTPPADRRVNLSTLDGRHVMLRRVANASR